MLRISSFKKKEIKKATLVYLTEYLKDVDFDGEKFDEFNGEAAYLLELKELKERLESEKIFEEDKISRKRLLLSIKEAEITKPIVSLLEKRLINKNLK